MAWLTAGFWSVGEVVGVVLTGVVGIGVGFEASVDDGCGRVDVHFSKSGAVRQQRALARLRANVADGACQEGVYKFRVVFVHDFAVDEGQVFGLLGERGLHES